MAGSSPGERRRNGRAPTRVVIVDAHPLVRRGTAAVLRDAAMDVRGEAATSVDALACIARERPDVAIVDVIIGRESGLDLVAAIRKAHPEVRVLVLSGHDEHLYADRALRAGALGYVAHDRAVQDLAAAVSTVAAGRPYVSAATAEHILSTMGPHPPGGHGADLSDRERHVLTLVGRGLSTREIAEALHLSVKTVETHYAHIKGKLGLRTVRELVRFAATWDDPPR